MSWIDCKVRKPTEADEDSSGRLFWRCRSGYTFCGCHDNARTDLVAWMQIPEFTPFPEPQYRPFQNAEEFRPFRERWWRRKDNETLNPPARYNDGTHHGYDWDEAFEKFEFEDGTPFGLQIN